MTPTISSSVLFNLNINKLTFSDNTNYSSFGISLANVDGNLKCTHSQVGIFYNNTGWSPPSIDLSVTNTKQVDLPISGGSVLPGTYTFDYTIQVSFSFLFTYDIIANNFYTPGDQTDKISLNQVGVVSSGPNIGTYTISSVFFDGINTRVTFAQPIPDTDPSFTWSINNEYTESTSYVFSDCNPTVVLELEADCDCATVTSQDITNYTVNINGNFFAPTSIARVHTVNAPVSPSTGTAVTGSTTSLNATIIVSPIWTTIWTSTVQTSLTYNINGLIVQRVVSGSAEVDVDCTNELCCAYSCLANIAANYQEFRNNLVRKEEWQFIATSATMWWMVYSVARTCGQTSTADAALTNLLEVARKSGCSCCTDNSAEPVQVIGLCGALGTSGSAGNVVVTTCGNGITVTPTTIGTTTTYQVCIDIQTLYGHISNYLQANPLDLNDLGDVVLTSPGSGSFIRFNGVNWVNVSSIAFSQITDVLITAPLNGQVLTYNSSIGKWVNSNNTGNILAIEQNTYSTSGTPLQTVKSISIPAGTLTQNGDYLDVETEWSLPSDSNNKQLVVGVSGLDIHTSFYLNSPSIRVVRMPYKIIRVSSTQVRIEINMHTYNLFAGYAYPPFGEFYYIGDPLSYAVNNLDTTSNTLQFRANPTAGGSLISLMRYIVKIFKF